MGFVFTIIFSLCAGALFLLGWASIDAICDCAPLSERVANGTLGLFGCCGAIAGAVMQIAWG